MIKVIIMAYDFPPYVSVGALRPSSWFKYLNEYGIYPIVITRQWQNKYGNELDYVIGGTSSENIWEKYQFGEIIRTPYKPNLSNRILIKYGKNKFKFVRKAISAYYEFFQFIFPIGPKKNIYRTAKKYLQKNTADVIITTGEPFVLFYYGHKLSNRFNTPWIADYRDPWSQGISLQKKHTLRLWSLMYERKILKSVGKVITVSQFVANKISVNCPSKKIHIIPNGFDPEIISKTSNISQDHKQLNISFAGTIYNWHPIQIFFKSLNELLIENPQIKIKLNFFGINNGDYIKKILSNYKYIEPHIAFHPKQSNEELLFMLAKSNALLLFNDYSIMGTKIYDYIGLKRKIIFCFANDKEAMILKEKHYRIDDSHNRERKLQSDLINRTNSGIVVQNSGELNNVILNLLNELEEFNKINCPSIDIDEFSRKKGVSELANVIKSLIKPNQHE